jgi:hypothetical protein
MRAIQKLASGSSFAQTRHWAPAMVIGFVIAICSRVSGQTGGEAVYAVTYLDLAARSPGRGVDLFKKLPRVQPP